MLLLFGSSQCNTLFQPRRAFSRIIQLKCQLTCFYYQVESEGKSSLGAFAGRVADEVNSQIQHFNDGQFTSKTFARQSEALTPAPNFGPLLEVFFRYPLYIVSIFFNASLFADDEQFSPDRY